MTPEHNAPPKPFQFTLRHMAGAILILSLCLALIVQLKTLGFGICGLGLGSYAFYKAWKLKSILRFTTGVMTIWICGFIALFPAVSTPRWVSRKASCGNNLHCIGIALHNYHDHYGCFPPAHIADASGKSMHSWRVLILPYLDCQDLYTQYNFNEPWNGPNNRKLALRIPREFQCPSDLPGGGPRSSDTSYLAVVGSSTAWPGQQPVSMKQISDGVGNTLLVIEVHHSGVNWLDPSDLDMTQMAPIVNSRAGYGIRSRHSQNGDHDLGEFAQVLYCDGSVRTLPNKLLPSTVRALLTIAGSEKVAPP